MVLATRMQRRVGRETGVAIFDQPDLRFSVSKMINQKFAPMRSGSDVGV